MYLRRSVVIPVFIATLSLGCSKPLYIQDRKHLTYEVNNNTAVDSSMVRMLIPYKAGVDTQMQVAVGRTDIPLTKAQPESTLGNLVADAQLIAARTIDSKVAASVVNYGGLRISYIAPGSITKGKIYELMPFDNMLTIVEVPGEILKQFCDHMTKAKGWPVSGIAFAMKDKKAVDIKVMNDPVNDHIIYKIAVSDYIANGGDNCDFLTILKKKHTNIFVRDAIIGYIDAHEKQRKPVNPVLEKRVQYAD